MLEQKEIIEDPLLKKISEVLKIPVEAFQNFDEQSAINIIANRITNNDNDAVYNHNPVFQHIDKLVQLHEEKITLYERMLKEKDEMIERLERLINN